MAIEYEAQMEERLINKLVENGYEYVDLNEKDLFDNLKNQIEKLNNITLSEKEFEDIKIELAKGDVFDKSKRLRRPYSFKRKNETFWINFLDTENLDNNIFQVSNQINTGVNKKFRYDVTILINGFPLTQIELKRRGIKINAAFDQIKKYKLHSYKELFKYIQLFVISNDVNTKYFANSNRINDLKFEFTFFWKERDNRNITDLNEFSDTFLNKYHLIKMISRYMVHNEVDRSILVLRAYQYYAVEKIIKTAEDGKGGYVWHATGSGKTLTSFKTSQILEQQENIDKILFVVDRKDLDTQTIEEFNKFSNNSIDKTDNTRTLVNQLKSNQKLILTTIQKLKNAVTIKRYGKLMEKFSNQKIVLIFDECHRSQSGTLHRDIKRFFKNAQLFGFTGTPIFEENAKGTDLRTTKEIFGDLLHHYTIKNAIEDKNILKFSIDYIGKWKRRNGLDIEVEDIDVPEIMEKQERLELIAEHILKIHSMKTLNGMFNGLFAVSYTDVASKYYNIFKELNEKSKTNYKIATIFSSEENDDATNKKFVRDTLKDAIKDYNTTFETNFDIDKSFDEYHDDVSDRFKKKEIDILIVVNMFLTGFDSKLLNTLYFDKGLKYHNLIQAFSRTNRINDLNKSHGNIVCYRFLKERVDDALELFSNEDSIEKVFSKSYDDYLEELLKIVTKLREVAPTYQDVDKLKSEKEQREFVSIFKSLLIVLTKMTPFVEFSYDDLNIAEEEVESYKSKYLDIYDGVMNGIKKGKTSILEDLDFEIELIAHDEINVDYILGLIGKLAFSNPSKFKKSKKEIIDLMKKSPILRSKIDLIEEFISQNCPKRKYDVDPSGLPNDKIENVYEEFERFFATKKTVEINELSRKEHLDEELVKKLVQDYEFTGKVKDEEIEATFTDEIGFLERVKKIERIETQIEELVERFSIY